MFELNGEIYSQQDIELAANKSGVPYDEMLVNLQEQGLTSKENGFESFLNDFSEYAKNIDLLGIASYNEITEAYRSGKKRAEAFDEAFAVFKGKESELSDEQLQEYIDAVRSYEKVGEMTELKKWSDSFDKYKKEGNNSVTSTIMAINDEGVDGLAQVMIQSMSSLLNKEIIGLGAAGAGVGAAAGAASTLGAGAVPGAFAGFFMGANTASETVLTFTGLLQEELQKQNLEFNPENIRKVLGDEDIADTIKVKAAARGATIGAIEGLSSLVGIKGSGTVVKAIAKSKAGRGVVGKGLQVAAGAGVAGTAEFAGGMLGETAGLTIEGKPLDAKEIILEGIAPLAKAPATVSIGAGKTLISRPKYKIKGESISFDKFKRLMDKATPLEIAKMDIEIENDDTYAAEIYKKQSKAIIATQVDSRVVGEDRDKLIDLEQQLFDLGGKDTRSAKTQRKELETQIDAITGKYKESDVDTQLQEQKEQVIEEVGGRKLRKNVEFAEKQAERLGAKLVQYENEASYLNRVKELGGNVVEAEGSDGVILGDEILINTEVAKQKGALSVGSHELLHRIIGDSFKLVKDKNKLLQDFAGVMTEAQRNVVEKRLKENYLQDFKIDNNKSIFDDANIGVWAEAKGEEVFTAFSDGIVLGDIQYDEQVFDKIKNVISKIAKALGINKEFSNGRQVYNFLKDYNKSVEKGKLTKSQVKFAGEDALTDDQKASYTKNERDTRLDKMGEAFTKEQWDQGEGRKAYFEAYANGDLETIIRNNISLDLRRAPEFLEEDAVNETLVKLKSDFEGFNINLKENQGFGLSGYIRQRARFRLGDVLAKGEVTQEKFTAKTSDELVMKEVEAVTAETQGIDETEDLSVAGQAKAQAEKAERQSKFRKQLGFETGGEMYNRVLQASKKSVLIAYRKTQSIKNPAKRARAIKDLLRKEYFTKGLTSDLFKSTKNFLGTKDYIKNLKQYREVIIESLSTADLVQMERKVPDNERVFTVFDKKLTKIEDVESAVQRGLLPTEAINAIQKGQAVNLYRKRMPTETEFIEFADQPAINPVTGARSGLKGTRKDGFAKAIANTMVLDAVMEVRQSEDVVEALEDDAIAQLDLMALSDAVGREVDVKFSKSTAVVDINNAIDNNINLAVYSQIKFSRSHREAYEARLAKKRTDLDEKQIKGAVESIFKFVEGQNIPNNKKAKYEKMAMHYMANGFLILPEDGYKVIEAERLASIKKLDPFSFKNPNALIEKYVDQVKGTRTNPDDVKTFTNKTQLTNGVTVYDVEDSKQGQIDSRKVIDTHFGKKANPWCLLANQSVLTEKSKTHKSKDAAQKFEDKLREQGQGYQRVNNPDGTATTNYDVDEGKVSLDKAFEMWKSYNDGGNGFKIAFQNGKLIAFRDGGKISQWWDRMDQSSKGIMIRGKKAADGFTPTIELDGSKETITGYEKGTSAWQQDNGSYIRKDLDGNIVESHTKVNGKFVGERIAPGSEGSVTIDTFKDGKIVKRVQDSTKEMQLFKNGYDVRIGADKITVGNLTKWQSTTTGDDVQLLTGTNKKVEVIEGTVINMSENNIKLKTSPESYDRYRSMQGEKVRIVRTKTDSMGNYHDFSSVTINGVEQDIGVKFSKSTSDKLEGTKQLTEKQSKKVLGTILVEQDAIEKRLNTEEELDGDQFALNALIEFQKAIESGTSPLTAYEMIIGKLPEGSNNISFKSAAEFVQTVKDISINKIREQGFKALVKYLEPKLKGKSLKSQKEIIDSFLRNGGRTGRTAKVFGITKNKQIKEQLIDQLLDGKFSEEYTLGPGKFGGEVFEGVELYENIENIKNNVRINNELRGKVNQQAQEARDFMFEILDSNLSLAEKYAIIDLLAIDQRGTIRKMYTMGATVTVKSNLSSKQLTLEHEITASDMVSYLKAYAKNNNKTQAKKVLNEILDQARVHVLPKKIDDALNKAGHKSTGGRGRYAVGTEARSMLQEMRRKGDIDFVPVELTEVKELNILGSAIQFSRSTKNPTKGISILDFDDTLATSKSLVKFTRPDGTKGTLTPEQYASTYEDLSDLGYKFDFSEFSKVVDGKPAPLLNKAKKLAGKFSTKDMFVLTARPADSAPAIREFLKQNGLDIPLKNITGLGNSTAEAKALWVADKVASGYNDFYFADDALKNVQAVQNMLDQFDVKSKVQQAKLKFSKSMSKDFNAMLERTKGVPFDEAFSRARALKLGKNKGKLQIFVPPSADDFEGLLYYFVGKGEQGNKDLQFFKEALLDPFNRAYTELDQSRQTIINDWKNLRNKHWKVSDKLGEMMPNSEFTFDNAIRVYLYDKAGHSIPGLSELEVENLIERVNTDVNLLNFATDLQSILKLDEVYLKPSEYWIGGSTAADVQEVSEKVRRAEFLEEWVENKNEVFSEANLNKIEATYGSRFRSALEDVLYRMETGRTRSSGSDDAISSRWMRWLNNSVGAIMFINTKSSLLQTISMVNYVNYVDNNPLQAAKAFANQKQYWADFAMIFNSDFLKQRRKGLKTDVQTAEIASAVANATNKAQAAVAYLLKKGFLPTQMADSFAIAAGGATFFRNRYKTYIKQGLTDAEAKEKAFDDFRTSTEESQQSARPDRISQQQVSNAGRILLNFQNYPMQQARIFKKALLGLARGTGDKKQHLSRIVFYGFAQNMIFLSLQNALFAMLFDHEDEEEEQKLFDTKMERILNGMVDTMLRGSGIAGGVIATGKNTILKAIQELEKGGRANEANVVLEALNLSPAIGSKLRKINKGFRTYKYNKEAIDEMSKFDINNPIWTTAAPVIEGVTNAPTDRSIRLINQVREGFNTDNTVSQRMSVLLGFSPYEIGLDPNKKVKEATKEGKRKAKGEEVGESKRCRAFSSSGGRCRNTTTNKSGLCYAHD